VTWITLALVSAIAVSVVAIYNGLIAARQRVREGWSAIDVQLQRRAALIPNLVEVVKAAYERETITKVVEARRALESAGGPGAAARASADLSGALHSIFALAEAYPELRASERFAQLQADLADTENKIAYARNYYNGAVEAYNIKVHTVPGVIVARSFQFAPAEFFSADTEDRAVPVVA
jgi:LemA protein